MKKRKPKTIKKIDICEDLYDKIGYSRQLSTNLVEQMLKIMETKLCSNHHVRLSNFGNFLLKDKKARKGRDPQSGKPITILARRTLVFHPSPTFKNEVNL